MALDKMGLLCLLRRGTRAADHFLVSRYFDYTQVAFHHTVVALELALERVIELLFKEGDLDCSGAAMRARIADKIWSIFDDQYLALAMRTKLKTTKDPIHKAFLMSVLDRRPPKLVLAGDAIDERDYEKRPSWVMFSTSAR